MRIESDARGGQSKNGKNGAHLIVEATGPSREDNSVEKSLEDFIARANSTFLSDGWDLAAAEEAKAPEPAPLPPEVEQKLAELETLRGEVDSLRARATSAEARAAEAIKVKAVTPIAPTQERTEVVRRGKLEPEVVTRTNWAVTLAALVVGAGAMFGVMKVLDKGDAGARATSPAVESSSPTPSPANVAPTPTPTPAPAEAAPAPAPSPTPAPAEPIVQPLPSETAPAPAEVAPAPAPAPAETAVKPADVAPAPVAEKKATGKAAVEKKAAAKKVEPKGGIVDPFGDPAPTAPKQKATPKKPPKPKSTQPKGGIVDPFAM